MTSITSTFPIRLTNSKTESEKPINLNWLPLRNQRQWCEVLLRHLKIIFTILKWDSLGDAWNRAHMNTLNIIFDLLAVK